ncbi:hypothetical protein Aperf_G00000076526 [Anoplocephala perfoliata]
MLPQYRPAASPMSVEGPIRECIFANKLDHPVPDIRRRAIENVINKLNRGLLSLKSLSGVVDIVVRNLQSKGSNEMLEFTHQISLNPTGRSLLYQSNVVEILLAFMSKQDFKESRDLIQSIISNIVSDPKENLCHGSFSRRALLLSLTNAVEMPNYAKSNFITSMNINPVSSISTAFYSFPSTNFVIENLASSSISRMEDQHISEFLRSIVNTSDLTILSKLRYFEVVILNDYPAEFFLRNPIFVQFIAALLVTSTSVRVQTSLANILNVLCRKSIVRIYHYANSNNWSSNESVKSVENSEILQFLSEYFATPSISTALEGSLIPPSVIKMPPCGISLPVFAVVVANTALSGFVAVHSSTTVTSAWCALLHLLNTAIDVFLCCSNVDFGRKSPEITSQEVLTKSLLPSHNLTPGFDNMLELWGILLSIFSKSWRDELNCDLKSGDFEQARCVYIGLLQTLFRFLFALWTPESCAYLLPVVTSFELSLAVLDGHFVGNSSVSLPAYVRLLDPEIALIHSKLTQLSGAIVCAADFIRRLDDLQGSETPFLEDLMTRAIKGLGAVEFFPDTYIPKFIKFLAEIPLVAEESAHDLLFSQSRSYLILLISHRLNDIRMNAYTQILELLSASISVENAADPNSRHYKHIMFLLNREILGEIVEFGAQDVVPEIASTARACLRLLLGSHQLIPENMWLDLVSLLFEPSSDLNSLSFSTEWRPTQPLISLLAGLSSEIKPVLEACLGIGGFKCVRPDHLTTSLSLLYHPQPSIRQNAASAITEIVHFTVRDVAELCTSLDETLCDLLIPTDAAMPVNEPMFEELNCRISVESSSASADIGALVEAMELVADEVADLEVRCTAAEQVYGILTSPGGLDFWHEVGGPGALLDWISILPGRMGYNLSVKLLIEPLTRVQLAIAHFVVIHDLESRNQFYLNQSVFLSALLQVGLCFWKESRIRRCISVIIALIIFNPAIRSSDESLICLPPAIITSFCLPFTCPFYSLKSRHPTEFPDFSCLLRRLVEVKKPSSMTSQRDRVLSVAVVRALRILLNSSLEGVEDELILDPLLRMTRTESVLLEATNPSAAFPTTLSRLQTSNTHKEAAASLSHFALLKVAFMRTSEASAIADNYPLWWREANLPRFLHVFPSCTEDYRLLAHCLQILISLEFSPPFINHHSLEVCNWLLEELTSPSSLLVYTMRRFDADVGSTDSPRLIEAKIALHFLVIPSLFDTLLACQDYLREIDEHSSQDRSPNGGRDDLKPSWMIAVQETSVIFNELYQQTIRLIGKIIEFQQTHSPHTGILYLSLELLHNTVLLLTLRNWKDSVESLDTSSILPVLTEVISGGYTNEIRYLSITILAQFISSPCTCLEGLGNVWSKAFDLFISPTEPPKIKAASAHLLTNLTAQIPRLQNSCVVENALMPSYVDPQTRTQVVGPDAVKCMLEQCNFFSLLSSMLQSYQSFPTFQKKEAQQIMSTGVFSTPLLVDRVCSLLGNLCLILPWDFVLQNFEEHRLCEALMNIINPAMFRRLISSTSTVPILGQTAARLAASTSAQILSLFSTLLSLPTCSPNQKRIFLSDRRFLVLLANCLTLDLEGMEELWEAVMLFFITLLDSKTDEGLLDLLQQHALHPLASVAHQLGTLLNHLLSRVTEINRTPPSGQEEGSRKGSRSATFNLLQVALTFLSVVLSRHDPNHSSPSDNPLPAALDSTLTTEQITSSLIALETSFPQPRINLEGILLDSGVTEVGIDETPHIFGQLEIHRQVVHSALKLLFCASTRAKEAALEADFIPTLFTVCRNLLDHLNRSLGHPKGLKSTKTSNPIMSVVSATITSSASDSSLSMLSERQVTEGRQLAWQCLVSHLICHLELLGNLLYNNQEVKRAAVQAGFLKLAMNIWPVGLIDSRVMHNLLFCLVNLTADSSLLELEASANDTMRERAHLALRPVVGTSD